MAGLWPLFQGSVLFLAGGVMFSGLPWVGHRLLTRLGGNSLAWSLTLLGWSAAWFLGAVLAWLIGRLGSRRVPAAGALALALALGAAWLALGVPSPAPAAAWSAAPVEV